MDLIRGVIHIWVPTLSFGQFINVTHEFVQSFLSWRRILLIDAFFIIINAHIFELLINF